MFRKILIMMFSLLIIACKSEEKKQESIQETVAVDTVKTFTLKGIKDGKKTWELEGEDAILALEQANEISINKPFMKFFDEQGQVKATVTANRAKVNSKTKDMHAMDEVVMISTKDKSTLYTTDIFYENVSGKFHSDAKVKIVREDSVTTGVGFDSPLDLSEVNIHKNVEISYQEKA